MRKHHGSDDFDGGPTYVVVDQHDAGIGPFLLGLALGAGAALLFAPRSGVEARRAIGNRVRDVRDAASEARLELQRKIAEQMNPRTWTNSTPRTTDRV